jgi:hypothetical protein
VPYRNSNANAYQRNEWFRSFNSRRKETTHLDAEIDDGHVRIVEKVQHIRLPKVQLLELYMVDGGVGDGGASQLHVVQRPLPNRLVLPRESTCSN